MEIQTRYDIGQEVYYLDRISGKVGKDTIKCISIAVNENLNKSFSYALRINNTMTTRPQYDTYYSESQLFPSRELLLQNL